MSSLPFLKPHGWPMERKLSGVSMYGFSEDDELIDKLLDEIMEAINTKDHKGLISALHALINSIQTKEDNNATDSL